MMKTPESITRKSLGLSPRGHQPKLMKLKERFLQKCIESETPQLKKLRGWHGDEHSRYSTHLYPNELDVRKAIHDHTCQRPLCKKIIKKGDFYFRRSFGQLWTIKACSIRCFLEGLP